MADPIYGLVDFGTSPRLKGTIRAVIDRSAFQRLRHIAQLGLASLVYPGATHTRFAHALGSAHLARRVLEHLGHVSAPKEYCDAVVVAALLHDAGHGPFSHTFERALEVKRRGLPNHERWTKYLITNTFAHFLDTSGVGAGNVADVLSKSTDVPKHLQQIVASQLDVDRMDYLVRDAHFSGVSMGQIDVGYLIRSLGVIPHPGGATSLGLVAKGVRAYEAYALARHQMNRSVYFHPLVAVFEFMMEECIRAASEGAGEVGALAPMVPPFLQATAKIDKLKAGDVESFMARHVGDYIALTDVEMWAMVRSLAAVSSDLSASRSAERAVALARRLLRRDPLTYYVIRTGRRELLERRLLEAEVRFGSGRSGSTAGERCRIFPVESMVYKGNDDGVFVIVDGEPKPIPELSFAIRAFQDRPERVDIVVLFDDEPDLDRLVTPFVTRKGNGRLSVARTPSYPPPGAVSA